MLQNRRRNRIARLIIGGMSTMPQKESKMDMDYEDKPQEKKKPAISSHEAVELACGSMLQAIRSDDVSTFCRAFKAAYRACEQYEEEMSGNPHGSY